jgi:hypothetical protein
MEVPPVAELLHPGSLFYVVTVIIHEAKEKNTEGKVKESVETNCSVCVLWSLLGT